MTVFTQKIRREFLKFLSKRFGLKSANTQFGKLRVRIPLVYGLGADLLGPIESRWTTRIIEFAFNLQPGAVIDVGANVGIFLLWQQLIDPSRSYIAFEPNPACHFFLQELIRINEFDDAFVYPYALASARSRSTFFAKRHGDKMGSLYDFNRVGEEQPRSFSLLTEIGDDLLAAIGDGGVSFLKIDVEGAELDVIKGLKRTLSSQRPVVLCEIVVLADDHPAAAQRRSLTSEIFDVLADLDYTLLAVDRDGRLVPVHSPSDLRHDFEIDKVIVHSSRVDALLEHWGLPREIV